MSFSSKQLSFEKECPRLLAEWNYEKNEKLPSEYLPQSGKKVWWKCNKGHEWETRIQTRFRGGKCKNFVLDIFVDIIQPLI